MKNIFKISLCAAALSAAILCQAQTTKQKINKDAKTAGHKTAEVAANAAATLVDKRYEGKAGPAGQTIYINKYSRYYYINHLGHKVYLKRSGLRNK